MIRTRWEPKVIYNQGKLGTCCSQAWAAACRSVWGEDSPTPKEIYDAIWDREIQKPKLSSYGYGYTGMSIRTAADILQEQGLITNYRVGYQFSHMRTLPEMLENGPVILSMPWYQSFNQKHRTILSTWGAFLGMHAVVILDCDGTRGPVIQNSHGPDWGHEGRAFLPWDTLEALLRTPRKEGALMLSADWVR